MIALGIAMTWLTLTAGGFAGLSALGRAGAREDLETDAGPLEAWPIRERTRVRVDAHAAISKALPR